MAEKTISVSAIVRFCREKARLHTKRSNEAAKELGRETLFTRFEENSIKCRQDTHAGMAVAFEQVAEEALAAASGVPLHIKEAGSGADSQG